MANLDEIADSRDSEQNTIRVSLSSSKYEDFQGNSRFFYVAFQNVERAELIGQRAEIWEGERYLEIVKYDLEDSDENGIMQGKTVAVFRANEWKYVRAL